MRKRVHIALAVLLVVIVGVIGWQVLREREPVYQGKPLRVWLKRYGGTGGGLSDKQAEAAIRQIGTNAIPLCLKIITTRESPLERKLMALIPNQWLARFHLRNVYAYRFQGAYGLGALDDAEAKPAVAPLVALLNHRDPDVRYIAAFTLELLGAVASNAVPALIKCLQDPDFRVQQIAIQVLGRLHQEPERVIPVLVEFLDKPQNPRYSLSPPLYQIMREHAIWSLRDFRAQAKPAVPSLLRLLNDGHPNTRSAVTNALLKIDPEAAAKAGVE